MKSWNYLFCAVLLIPLISFSQPRLSLEKTSIDYGQITYGGSNLISEFQFKNTGNEPLIITRVSTGDGGFMCKSYPKEPILPNQMGVVQFIYDTKRIGFFTRSGYIQSNAIEANQSVRIHGQVIPAPILYFTRKELNLGTINAGDLITFELYNYGTAPLILSKISPVNHTIPLSYSKDTLGVQDEMKLEFYPKLINANTEFDLEWDVYSNATKEPKRVRAWGKLNYTPLIFDTSNIQLGNASSVTHFFKINCNNESSDELEVYRISKDVYPEKIWFPSEQIYFSEGKKYTISGGGSAELLVGYQLYNYYPHAEKIYIYSRNKKTGKEYVNVLRLN